MAEPPILNNQFDHNCGADAGSSDDPPQVALGQTAVRPQRVSLLQNKWAVLAILFLATAALGLPLLWRCKTFSPRERVIWSIIVVVYTGLIFWAFSAVMMWSYGRIVEALY